MNEDEIEALRQKEIAEFRWMREILLIERPAGYLSRLKRIETHLRRLTGKTCEERPLSKKRQRWNAQRNQR